MSFKAIARVPPRYAMARLYDVFTQDKWYSSRALAPSEIGNDGSDYCDNRRCGSNHCRSPSDPVCPNGNAHLL